jgi:hypothetical protein
MRMGVPIQSFNPTTVILPKWHALDKCVIVSFNSDLGLEMYLNLDLSIIYVLSDFYRSEQRVFYTIKCGILTGVATIGYCCLIIPR